MNRFVILLISIAVASPLVSSGTLGPVKVATAATSTNTKTPIKHLVILFQENVSFDHYFGTYPNATNPPGEPKRIDGFASIFNPQYPIMPFAVTNLTEDKNRWPQITLDQFSNNVMRRLGLSEEFIIDFPLKLPPSLLTHPNLPSGIKGILTDLNTLVSSLNNAVNILRNSRTTNDYRQVMDQVKTSVETIYSYVKNTSNKKNLAKEIFIDVGVITDIDPTGAEIPAEDVIEKFGNILECIYQISSKPAHTKPKPSQPQLKFKFSPESSDAEFVLNKHSPSTQAASYR